MSVDHHDLTEASIPHKPVSPDNGTTPTHTLEMDDSQILVDTPQHKALSATARHTLGLFLLLCVVFLWTLSNFLGSSIFADSTYAKPFFLTYLNTSCFVLCIVPRLVAGTWRRSREELRQTVKSTFTVQTVQAFIHGEGVYTAVRDEEELFLETAEQEEMLGVLATARLSLSFCLLWFAANYFAMACLQFTTVASTTVLTSTSSIWTLLIGALTRMEKFTWKKLCGVLASLAGVVLISQVDFKSADVGKRALDEFPDKTPYELAAGDALALLSAIIYGFYTIQLKKTTVAALPRSLHMPTFFGFVGLFNMVLLFPLFPVLHFSGVEEFVVPPTLKVWSILLINSVSSLVSDICWAYALHFTSPLVVTVGLSLTIPLSLVGEVIIQGRSESWLYWVGAMIVVGSFVFVEREEKHEEEHLEENSDLGEPGPAIVIEDYDEPVQPGRSRPESPPLLDSDSSEH